MALLASGPAFAQTEVPDAPARQGARAVLAVALGLHHTCALIGDPITGRGGVQCWGRNDAGQLGDGTTTNRSIAGDVPGLTAGVAAISAGHAHTCAVLAGGTIACWGAGFGVTPQVVGNLQSVTAVLAAGNHTCALIGGPAVDSGSVKCWGDNYYGQLGDGTTEPRPAPVYVKGLPDGVQALAGGEEHTCALTVRGAVLCWGSNRFGQLGDGSDALQRTTATLVAGLGEGAVAITANGYHLSRFEWPYMHGGHSCALTATGAVKCWGNNETGQLGDGTTLSHNAPVDAIVVPPNVVAISAGGQHTCALLGSGVQCWGSNWNGQMGNGTALTRELQPVPVAGLSTGVKAIAGGIGYVCAVLTAGGAQCWGDRFPKPNPLQPATVYALGGSTAAVTGGTYHTCVRLQTAGGGRAACWGVNQAGELGDGTRASRFLPAPVFGLAGGGQDLRQIVAGGEHSCALTEEGGVECWGENDWGQVGNGTLGNEAVLPVPVIGLAGGVQALALGSEHTCAFTDGGGVKCWGSNLYGQLGDGTTDTRTSPAAVVGLSSGMRGLGAGDKTTCAITSGGGVKCWGYRIGGSDSAADTTPADVPGLERDIQAVAVGNWHVCVLTKGGGVKCWGDNYAGQLGDGSDAPSSTPVDVQGLGSGVQAISLGATHSCALTTIGDVYCWGSGAGLADGVVTSSLTPQRVQGLGGPAQAIGAGSRHTCAVISGAVQCWGDNWWGQLGQDPGWLPMDIPLAMRLYLSIVNR